MKKILKYQASLFMAFTLAACGGDKTSEAPTETPTVEVVEATPTESKALQAVDVPALPDLDVATLKGYITTLASDDFLGRAPATKGGQKTRDYLAAEMQKIGLKPGNGDSYEQIVPLVETTAVPAQSSFKISMSDGGSMAPAYGPEIMYWTKQVKEEVSFADSDVVFVGYGVVAPEYGWNDYEGIDVTGKTVVILVNDPGYATQDPELFNGRSMTYYGRWTYKYEEAARQGAAAAFVIHQTAPAAYGWGVVEGSWAGPQLDLKRPDNGESRVVMEGWLHEDTAKAMFTASGMDFDAQLAAAQTKDFTPSVMNNLKAEGTITNTIRYSNSANVAGIIEGTTHADEYVLYMAHWDHLGVNAAAGEGEDAISNGAVDNATGTGGIIAIAKSIMEAEVQPKRSMIFVAVTAEESGLLGSAYYAEDPLVPFNKTIGGINIDAILPTPPVNDLIVVGYGASELEDLLNIQAKMRGKYLRPDAEPEKGYFYRSDHISLAKKGVPMLYADSGIDFIDGGEDAGRAFGASYTENRYHKPGDEITEAWDYSGLTETLEMLRDTGASMAYSDVYPNWYEGNEFRALRDAQMAE